MAFMLQGFYFGGKKKKIKRDRRWKVADVLKDFPQTGLAMLVRERLTRTATESSLALETKIQQGTRAVIAFGGNFCRLMKVRRLRTCATTVEQWPSGKYSREATPEKESVCGLVILGAVNKD